MAPTTSESALQLARRLAASVVSSATIASRYGWWLRRRCTVAASSPSVLLVLRRNIESRIAASRNASFDRAETVHRHGGALVVAVSRRSDRGAEVSTA